MYIPKMSVASVELGATTTNARVGELIDNIIFRILFFASAMLQYLVIIFWLSTDETFNRNDFLTLGQKYNNKSIYFICFTTSLMVK